MKKIFSILLLGCILLFTGCSKSGSTDEVSKVTKYLSDLESYVLDSTMTINRSDKKVTMKVGVHYLAPSYYKVSFKTQDNNEQLIIKNDSGVFVLTPSLNKEFKFDSDWPLNSSHAYLLEAILKDIQADTNSAGTTENDLIKVECAITHKTNQNLTKMNYYCSKSDLTPKKTVFLNDKNEEIVIVDFQSFDSKTTLTKEDFNEKKYLVEQEEKDNNKETSGVAVTVGYEIEGNSLNSSTTKDDVTIMCYSGEKPYSIVVQEAATYAEVVVMEEYTDFEVLSEGLCFFNENCMKYFLKDYEVVVYSKALSIEEYLNIAGSISIA